ncbi:MAG: fasciclin domain-containing protein [Planctomycetes bacterium]|nr:fasciclin domain-containing protein [Planctomycetota bacterium]
MTAAALLTATLSAQKDIVTTAVEAGSFGTLLRAAEAAGLVDTLRGDGPLTVFAPTDAAFEKLGKHAVTALLQADNRDRLRAILTYHIVPGEFGADDVLGRFALPTANGQRVPVEMNGDGAAIGGAGLVKTDVRCSNGIIHVLDAVMMPVLDDIPTVAKAAGSFGTLLAAAKAAGLVRTLAGDGPLTVLAPTDEAFEALPEGTVASLLRRENRAELKRILSYHVIAGRVYADQAVAAMAAKSVSGEPLRFGIEGGRLQVEGANVVGSDVQASNGVIHVVDRVLMPPAAARPAGRLVVGLFIERPSAALAAQLGIDRDSSLLVTGITPDGGADRAGLQRYDVLTSLNGEAATSANLDRIKQDVGYDGAIAVRYVRRGEHDDTSVRVGVERH